jgi:hypothetical protein
MDIDKAVVGVFVRFRAASTGVYTASFETYW